MASCFQFVRCGQQLPQDRRASRSSGRTLLRRPSFRLCARGLPRKGDEDEPLADGQDQFSSEEEEASEARKGSREAAATASSGEARAAEAVLEAFRQADAVSEEDEPFVVVLEASIANLPFEDVVQDMTAQTWTEGSLAIEELAPGFDIGVGDVEVLRDDGGVLVQERILTFTMPIPPAPMLPKTTRGTTRVRVTTSPRRLLEETTTQTHDAPFGSSFVIQVRNEFVWDDDDMCTATKTNRLVFLQRVGWFKSIIQNSVMAGQTKSGDIFLASLRKRAVAVPAKPRSTSFSMQRGLVWEVQRRTTLLSSWSTPFLFFDGDKRWRWVDAGFLKHHWLPKELTRQAAAASEEPPIAAFDGWEPVERWQVSREGGDADAEGWQYASGFSSGRGRWGRSSLGRLCRRRLWTCDFREAAS